MRNFEHDCQSCEWLGPFSDEQYGDMDLYWCPESVTVLSRFGNGGPEYVSGLPLMFAVPSLLTAFRRAYALGLVSIVPVSSDLTPERG